VTTQLQLIIVIIIIIITKFYRAVVTNLRLMNCMWVATTRTAWCSNRTEHYARTSNHPSKQSTLNHDELYFSRGMLAKSLDFDAAKLLVKGAGHLGCSLNVSFSSSKSLSHTHTHTHDGERTP